MLQCSNFFGGCLAERLLRWLTALLFWFRRLRTLEHTVSDLNVEARQWVLLVQLQRCPRPQSFPHLIAPYESASLGAWVVILRLKNQQHRRNGGDIRPGSQLPPRHIEHRYASLGQLFDRRTSPIFWFVRRGCSK